MRSVSISFALLLSVFIISNSWSQINITSLMEGQFGKLPNESADPFPSLYDRLEVDYRKKGFSVSTTIEQYHTTFDGRSYFDLSQLTLGYKKKKWDIKLGNFYETLGRGILLRSFEFPGALLEDVGFRSRTYFHRDMLGASVKYKTKKATFQIIHADVLNNVLPPIFDRSDRRTDNITAALASVKYVKGHELEIIAMRLDFPNQNPTEYFSLNAKGTIAKGLNYYVEYARNTEENDYALYAGFTGFYGNFSYSLEYKDYDNFSLGAGNNEPPAAVKQQTYRVLNRSIHVSDPFNERGYQIDLFYNFNNGTILNLNHSLARNIFSGNATTFRQYFVEIQSSLNKNLDYKAFLDYSEDPFKGESNRFSAGLYTDIGINENVRILPEIEYQTFDRRGTDVYNFNMAIGLNIQSIVSFSVLAEVTNDPFLLQDDQSTKIYLGNTIRYKPNYKNTFQLFFGERRGGPQCTAGVCYEILDFRGAEIRWISKFRI